MEFAGQSHFIFGTDSSGSVMTSLLSKLCCAMTLYKPLENVDAIAQLEFVVDISAS